MRQLVFFIGAAFQPASVDGDMAAAYIIQHCQSGPLLKWEIINRYSVMLGPLRPTRDSMLFLLFIFDKLCEALHVLEIFIRHGGIAKQCKF